MGVHVGGGWERTWGRERAKAFGAAIGGNPVKG